MANSVLEPEVEEDESWALEQQEVGAAQKPEDREMFLKSLFILVVGTATGHVGMLYMVGAPIQKAVLNTWVGLLSLF